jgi:hypothetical protein
MNDATNGKKLWDMKPNLIGVYCLHLSREIVYIGQAHCIRTRIQHHEREGEKEFDSYSFANLMGTLERMNYPTGKMYLDWVECWEIARAEPIYNRRIPKMSRVEMMMPVGLIRFCRNVSQQEGVASEDDFLRLHESLQTAAGRKLNIDCVERLALCANLELQT